MGLVFFNGALGSEQGLFVTDGAVEGTRKFVDLNGDTFEAELTFDFTPFGEGFLFIAQGETPGFQPFVTDGTPEGTQVLGDFFLVPDTTAFTVTESGAFFTSGPSMVFTDGTPEGTTALSSPIGLQVSPTPDIGVLPGDGVVFASFGERGNELAIADRNGVTLLADLNPAEAGPGQNPFLSPELSSFPNTFTAFNDKVLFAAQTGPATTDPTTRTDGLWITDGTSGGTVQLAAVEVATVGRFGIDADDSDPRISTGIGVLDDVAVFFANDVPGNGASEGYTLWITTGTSAGTREISTEAGFDFDPAVPGDPTSIVVPVFAPAGDGLLVFRANETELWVTDGTPFGTKQLEGPTLNDGSVDGETFGVLGDGRVLVSGQTGVWVTDGTDLGTQKIIDPSVDPQFPDLFFEFAQLDDGRAILRSGDFFETATTPDAALWLTDGTPGGTQVIGGDGFAALSNLDAERLFSFIPSLQAPIGLPGFVLADDAFTTNEASLVAGSVFADNGDGADSAPDGADLVVGRVDGQDASVGEIITLASGAKVRMNADGTFTYGPNGAFVALNPGESATDAFTYQVGVGGGEAIGATGVFELSDLDGSNGFVINGIDGGDAAGFSVSGAGDVNGDGFDDVIIGAPYAQPGGTTASGESYVVFGGAGGFGGAVDLSALDGSNGFVINGVDDSGNAGWSVSGAGDVNGDGFDDVIIGAPGLFEGENADGDAFVVFGAAGGFNAGLDLTDLNGTNGFRLSSDAADVDLTGVSVSAAGDLNGDGFGDLIVSDFAVSPRYVVFGSGEGFSADVDLDTLDGSDGFALAVPGITSQLGAVSAAGDVNGDGLDDLLIGAPLVNPTGTLFPPFGDADISRIGAGESYVVFGSTADFPALLQLSALDGSNGFAIDGVAGSDYSGTAVSSAGDVNGDGFDDVIIGAGFADRDPDFEIGESYVVFGAAGGFASDIELSELDGSDGFVIRGVDALDFSGWDVSSAGDINDDGFDDVLVSAYFADPTGRNGGGETYVIFGAAEGFSAELDLADIDGTNGFVINGVEGGDGSGFSVSAAGDVNGDGVDDLLIGARFASIDDQSGAGETYIVFGSGDVAQQFSAPATVTVTINGLNDDPSVGDVSVFNRLGAQTGVFATLQDAIDDPATPPGARLQVRDGVGDVGDVDVAINDLTIGGPAGVVGALSLVGGTRKVTVEGEGAFDVTGNAEPNRIQVGDGGGVLDGASGRDELTGGSGDDTFLGGQGGDLMIGGDGVDTVDYSGAASGVDVVLARGVQRGAEAEGDRLSQIEIVIGTDFTDTLGAVNDGQVTQLIGGAGDDDLFGARVDADLLNGGAGEDELIGRGGDDILIGGAGADVLNGGQGVDTADYSQSGAAVDVRLWRDGAQEQGDAQGDVLSGIERVIGSAFNDALVAATNIAATLEGGLGDDFVFGAGNTDVLSGGEGADILFGRGGDDALSGGIGADTFVFTAGSDADTIIDFTDGEDVIDLSGSNATSDAQLTIENGLFGATITGFGEAGDIITLLGVNASVLGTDDFVF